MAAATAAVVATFFIATATTAAAKAFLFEAATAPALLLGLRFIYDDFTAHYFGVVKAGDSLLCFTVVFHFHKTEAFATAGNFVFNNFGRRNSAVLFKKVS